VSGQHEHGSPRAVSCPLISSAAIPSAAPPSSPASSTLPRPLKPVRGEHDAAARRRDDEADLVACAPNPGDAPAARRREWIFSGDRTGLSCAHSSYSYPPACPVPSPDRNVRGAARHATQVGTQSRCSPRVAASDFRLTALVWSTWRAGPGTGRCARSAVRLLYSALREYLGTLASTSASPACPNPGQPSPRLYRLCFSASASQGRLPGALRADSVGRPTGADPAAAHRAAGP